MAPRPPVQGWVALVPERPDQLLGHEPVHPADLSTALRPKRTINARRPANLEQSRNEPAVRRDELVAVPRCPGPPATCPDYIVLRRTLAEVFPDPTSASRTG